MNIRDVQPKDASHTEWSAMLDRVQVRRTYWSACRISDGRWLEQSHRYEADAIDDAKHSAYPAIVWSEPDGGVLWCSWMQELTA